MLLIFMNLLLRNGKFSRQGGKFSPLNMVLLAGLIVPDSEEDPVSIAYAGAMLGCSQQLAYRPRSVSQHETDEAARAAMEAHSGNDGSGEHPTRSSVSGETALRIDLGQIRRSGSPGRLGIWCRRLTRRLYGRTLGIKPAHDRLIHRDQGVNVTIAANHRIGLTTDPNTKTYNRRPEFTREGIALGSDVFDKGIPNLIVPVERVHHAPHRLGVSCDRCQLFFGGRQRGGNLNQQTIFDISRSGRLLDGLSVSVVLGHSRIRYRLCRLAFARGLGVCKHLLFISDKSFTGL